MKKLLRRSCGAFTMADRLSRVYTLGSKSAFTMAEILISLTIIGVIAAITLPSLRANINEKTWATQKKALLSRMSQAIAMMDAQNTYTNAQDYVTSGLSEVLKINNICDGTSATTLADCGITGNVINMTGSAMTMPITWNALGVTKTFTNPNPTEQQPTWPSTQTDLVAAFETQNGESVMVFYNPDCIPDNDDAPTGTQPNMINYVCANMIYDLNQDKGPNTAGKDIGFMTVFYASDSVVSTALANSTASTAISATASCPDDYRIPNLTEATAIQLNWNILGGTAYDTMLTSARAIDSATGDTYIYKVSKVSDLARVSTTATTGNTRCVKR